MLVGVLIVIFGFVGSYVPQGLQGDVVVC